MTVSDVTMASISRCMANFKQLKRVYLTKNPQDVKNSQAVAKNGGQKHFRAETAEAQGK